MARIARLLGRACSDTRGLALVMGLATIGTACGPPPPATSALLTTSLVEADSNETHVAYARGDAARGRPSTIVVAYNDIFGVSMGWSWSSDGLAWNNCNASSLACGGVIPLAVGTSRTQVNWRGDPAIAAAADGSFVATTNLANSQLRPSGAPDMIVAALSFDGGRSFVRSFVVNDTNCIGSFEDNENVAVDATLPNRIWAVWRHRGTDLGVFGLCVRGGDVNVSTQSIAWTGPPQPAPVETQFGHGFGSAIVQGGDGAVTVVYSNTDNVAQCAGTAGVVWLSVTSFDGGNTWPQVRIIFSSALQRTCLPTAAAAQVQPGIRNFGFVRDSFGAYWVALPDDDLLAVRLYVSYDRGGTWNFIRTVVSGRPGDFHFFPTLAADPNGRVGLEFQSISPANAVATWFSGHRNFGPTIGGSPASDWSAPVLLTATSFLAGAPRGLGDYNGMVGLPVGGLGASQANFFAAWADTTVSPPRSAVHIAGLLVTP